MSITDQFWQYAKEAILSASSAKTDEERQGLLELAQTWTQAALLARQSHPSRHPGGRGRRRVKVLPFSKLWTIQATFRKVLDSGLTDPDLAPQPPGRVSAR